MKNKGKVYLVGAGPGDGQVRATIAFNTVDNADLPRGAHWSAGNVRSEPAGTRVVFVLCFLAAMGYLAR